MKTKFIALVMGIMLVLGMGAVAGAGEVQSLRGDVGVNQPDASSTVFQTKEGMRFERNYRQQPPLIPHRIDKYEIDLKVNQCLRCHDWPNNVKENAPMVSISHFLDRDGNRLDKVSGNRWFCIQCHVPQADAKPLVGNKFEPVAGSK